jgi:uncharacterized protein
VENEQAFLDAIKTGDDAQVEALLAEQPQLLNVKIDAWMSPVLLALYYGQPYLAHLLWKRGAPLDIFSAAAIGDLDQLQALLAQNPEQISAFSQDGFQPLGLAAFFGQQEAAAFLVANGAPVDESSRNDMRVRPLHSAAASRQLEICRLLLDKGANINAVQADEFTPLHGAAQNGDVELVKLLLDRGADVHARTETGATPLALAEAADQEVVASLLRAYDQQQG